MSKYRLIVEVDEDRLRKCRLQNAEVEADTESVEDAITAEAGWMQDSGIVLESLDKLGTPVKAWRKKHG